MALEKLLNELQFEIDILKHSVHELEERLIHCTKTTKDVLDWYFQWLYLNDVAILHRNGEIRHKTNRKYSLNCRHSTKRKNAIYSGHSIDDCNAMYRELGNGMDMETIGNLLDIIDDGCLHVCEDDLRLLGIKFVSLVNKNWYACKIEGNEPNQILSVKYKDFKFNIQRQCWSQHVCVCALPDMVFSNITCMNGIVAKLDRWVSDVNEGKVIPQQVLPLKREYSKPGSGMMNRSRQRQLYLKIQKECIVVSVPYTTTITGNLLLEFANHQYTKKTSKVIAFWQDFSRQIFMGHDTTLILQPQLEEVITCIQSKSEVFAFECRRPGCTFHKCIRFAIEKYDSQEARFNFSGLGLRRCHILPFLRWLSHTKSKITYLDLSNNSLSGPVASDIAKACKNHGPFAHLQYLNLNCTHISKSAYLRIKRALQPSEATFLHQYNPT